MTKQGNLTLGEELKEEYNNNKYLRDYLDDHYNETSEYPLYVDEDEVEDYDAKYPNLMYKVDDDKYVHIYGSVGNEVQYYSVEPVFDDYEEYRRILEKMHRKSGYIQPPENPTRSNKVEYITELFDKSVTLEDSLLSSLLERGLRNKEYLTDEEYDVFKYSITRNLAGLGQIDIVMQDSNIEDIHIIGNSKVDVDHGTFGLIPTDLAYENEEEYDRWIKNMAERMNISITNSNPIVDSTLPNGSRVNIVYSDDVSVQGPTTTIRQGDDVPLSVLQITKWGTMSPKMAAYLWICLENDQTVFVIGETASGKTTTLNAISSFIPRDKKIYTAEDTLEVKLPHPTWQRLMTRETTGESSEDVDMNDLLEAALRARPEYIIVGEVRGEEATTAFNAAETGHPVMMTFHAADVPSAIGRLTEEPMDVPKNKIDNADIFLFQNRLTREGDDNPIRRVTGISEIQGYQAETDSIITTKAFDYIPSEDNHIFTGLNNSEVLETIAKERLGYEDASDIYDELDRRTRIIERLIDNDILSYEDTNITIDTIQKDGVESLDNIDTTGLINN